MKHHKVAYFSLFSERIIALFFIVLGLIFAFFWFHIRTDSADVKEYRTLMADSDTGRTDEKTEAYTAKQNRLNVQKEVLFIHQNERMKLRLNAAESRLVWDHHDDTTSLLEQMREVKCLMQEELYYLLPDGREATRQSNGKLMIRNADPKDAASWIEESSFHLKPMQIIRYFEADQAVYHYQAEVLKAEKVYLSRFVVQGHQLIESVAGLKSEMNGIALKVEFSLSENHFKADQFKAVFSNVERLR